MFYYLILAKPIISAVFTTTFINENELFLTNLHTTEPSTIILSGDKYFQLDSDSAPILATDYITDIIDQEVSYSSTVIAIFVIGIFFSFITTVGNLMVMVSDSNTLFLVFFILSILFF